MIWMSGLLYAMDIINLQILAFYGYQCISGLCTYHFILYTNTFQPPHQVECQGLVVEIMVTVIQPQKENNPRKALQVARPV